MLHPHPFALPRTKSTAVTSRDLKACLVRLLMLLLVLNPVFAARADLKHPQPENQPVTVAGRAGLVNSPPPSAAQAKRPQDQLTLAEMAALDDEITLDKRQADKMIFAVFAGNNLRQRRLSELLGPALAVLVEAYKLSPALNPNELAPLFQISRNNLPQARVQPPKSLLRTGIVAATEIATAINGKAPAVTPAIVEKINLDLRTDDFLDPNAFNPFTDVLKPVQYALLDVKVDEFVQAKLEEAFDLAIVNEAFYTAFTRAFGDYLGVGMFDGAAAILQNSPVAPDYLKAYLKPNGNLSVFMADAVAKSDEQFDLAKTATDENLKLLGEINTNQFTPSPQATLALRQAANSETADLASLLAGDPEEDKFLKREKLINQIGNGINVLAKVVGFFSRDNAEKIRKVGQSVIKFAKDANNFVKYARLIATNPLVRNFKFVSLLPLGNPLMAIGVLGIAFAAIKIFKLFGSDSRVLKQLKQIAAQINTLRQEMHERFDRIDHQLDILYFKMTDGFNRMIELGIYPIQEDLIKVHAELNRLESRVYDWIDADSRRTLNETINLAIGYKRRNGLEMSAQDFDRYANTFYTWAFTNSKDPIALGSLNRDYSDSKIYDELSNYPLEANINYLAQFPARNLGLPALSNVLLPNPRYWSVSTSADTQLRAEWPALNQQIATPERRRGMYDLGRQLQDFVEAITLLKTATGVRANHPLVDALLSKYDAKADKLRAALKKIEDDYKNDPANTKPTEQIKNVSLWLDANQAPPLAAPASVPTCLSPAPVTLAPPSNIERLGTAMPAPFRTAARLGLGDLRYCTTVDWGAISGQTTNLTISFEMRYRAQPTDNTSYLKLSLAGLGPITVGDYTTLTNRWNASWKAEFEQRAILENRYTTAQINAIATSVEEILHRHRAALAAKIASELARVGPAQSATRELAGVKKLIVAYLSFGMSRSLEENDALRGLLNGDQQLPDDVYLTQVYDTIRLAPPGSAFPNGDIQVLTTTRLNALGEVVHGLLDDLARFRLANPPDARLVANTEGLLAVDNPVQDLELAVPTVTVGKQFIAHAQAVPVTLNQNQPFTLTGFDSDGAPLSYVLKEPPKHGDLLGAAPNLVYSQTTLRFAGENFVGRDSLKFTVKAGDRESAVAEVTFTVAGAACATPGYQSSVVLGNAREPYALVSRDFNRDGNPDLAVCDATANTVRVMFGNGRGGFADTATLPVGQNPVALTVDDFNGDGRPDLVTANYRANNLTVLLQNNLGGFTATAVSPTVGSGPRGLATADFNNDERRDLVVANRDSRNVSILLGNGDGTFKTPPTNIIVGGAEVVGIKAADLNNDGKPDIAVTVGEFNSVVLLFGKGDGTFEAPLPLAVDARPLSLALGDFNGDTHMDIAVGNFGSTRLSVLFGDGAGGFRAARHFEVGIPCYTLASANLNQDGWDDLVVGGFTANRIAVLLGDGIGSFGAPINYNTGSGVTDVLVGDFNFDKRLDLLVANSLTPSVTLLTGGCTAAATVATVSSASFNPPPAPVARDSIVSLFGAGFSATTQSATAQPLPTALAGTSVNWRDSLGTQLTAPLFFVSPGQINCHVPPGLAPGLATVSVNSNSGAVIEGAVSLANVAPGLFTANANGKGVPAAVLLRVKANGAQSFETVARFDTGQNQFVPVPLDVGDASDQVFLLLFGTGTRGRSSLASVSVTIGGVAAEVLYAGPQGGFVGLDQLNVRLPRALSGRGEVELALSVEGVAANAVRVSFK